MDKEGGGGRMMILASVQRHPGKTLAAVIRRSRRSLIISDINGKVALKSYPGVLKVDDLASEDLCVG